MWSDDIDNKIREAAGAHDSSYADRDWEKMEKLLDKHLPQEKKRRRFFFFWVTGLLLPGIALFIFWQNSRNKPVTPVTHNRVSTIINPSINNAEKTKNTAIEPATAAKQADPVNKTSTLPAIVSGPKNELPTQKSTPYTSSIVEKDIPAKAVTPIAKSNSYRLTNFSYTSKKVSRRKVNAKTKTSKEKTIVTPTHEPVQKDNLPSEILLPNTNTAHTEQSDIKPVTDAGSLKTSDSSATDQASAADTSVREEPAKKSAVAQSQHTKKLALTFSLGPDLSSVGLEKTGQITMQYGIGLSYALNKKLSLRAGFFRSRKIYSADSADYHPPEVFWNYYPNLQKIEANCLVYEIPVSLVYYFPAVKKHQWFVSAGLSSYIMKNETYEYAYKNPAGMPQYRTRTISNENKHFFSVLGLSGGYQYNLSNRFSIMAEPYMKLPVSGVGFGKVKLNSTGVLFTLIIKP